MVSQPQLEHLVSDLIDTFTIHEVLYALRDACNRRSSHVPGIVGDNWTEVGRLVAAVAQAATTMRLTP